MNGGGGGTRFSNEERKFGGAVDSSDATKTPHMKDHEKDHLFPALPQRTFILQLYVNHLLVADS
jgi:hypothetical protein